MKEYGADLEKQYIEAKHKLKYIEKKIAKRAKMVFKQSPDHILIKNMNDNIFNSLTSLSLLSFIICIEQDYVSKSKQLKLKI